MAAVKEIPLEDLARTLNRRIEDFVRLDCRPLLKELSLLIKADVKERFVKSNTPDGIPWLPLKNPSKRRGGINAKPLRDKGLLMASIVSYTQGSVEEITADSVTVGTNLGYAGYQNDGTRNIPAREFMGLSAAGEQEIDEAIADYFADNL